MNPRGVMLRPTAISELDFVLALERHPDNVPFIGQWSRDEHAAVIGAADREHWIIEADTRPAGYLIAYDLVSQGFGVYVKRIVVESKGRGLGQAAITSLTRHAVDDLGAPYVWLAVLADNRRAQRSYAAAGFGVATLTATRRSACHQAVGGFSESSLLMVHPGDASLGA
jgi:diamine N-acetyltransferase